MKASIIIINYNDRVRVRRAIESALNQTHNDKEIILVDDGSDEETKKIYAEYINPAFNLILLHRDDKAARTPSRARNAGIKKASGEYICFLDSDNYYSSTFVEDLIKMQADVAYCDWAIFGLKDYNVNIGDVFDKNKTLLENYLTFNHIDHQALLIKKKVLDEVGHYDERLPRSQDCDLIARLMLKTPSWAYVQKRLFFFEKHEDDQTKHLASIYWKTLWSLKLDIPIIWLYRMAGNNLPSLIAINTAIKDFSEKKEWTSDFKKSKFSIVLDITAATIHKESREVA